MADGVTIHAFLWEKNGPIVDLNDLISPHSDVTLFEAVVINDSGRIGVNGLPPGCDDLPVCGHAYVLIPSGDCDDLCEQRLAEHQRDREAAAQLLRSQNTIPKPATNMSTADRVRNMMRRHLGLQDSHPTLRD